MSEEVRNVIRESKSQQCQEHLTIDRDIVRLNQIERGRRNMEPGILSSMRSIRVMGANSKGLH